MATPCFHGNNFPLFFYVFYSLAKSILLLISNGSSITPLSCSYHTPCLSHSKIPSTLQETMKMFPHYIVFPRSPTWKKSYSATFIPLITCLLTPYKIWPLTIFFFCYTIPSNFLAPWRMLWLLFVNTLKTSTLLPTALSFNVCWMNPSMNFR